MRVSQYKENPKASVYFYDKRFFRGVMLKGTMEVLEDVESKGIYDKASENIKNIIKGFLSGYEDYTIIYM